MELKSASASTRRVLLADDESVFAESTRDLLRSSGVACDIVADTDLAVAMARVHHYHALIADIHMPGNQNLRLLSQLRDQGLHIPTILVTGYPSLETAIRAIDYPVIGYLIKPIDFDHLLERLTTLPQSAPQQRSPAKGHRLVGELAGESSLDMPAVDLSIEQSIMQIVDLLEHITESWERQRDPGRSLAPTLRRALQMIQALPPGKRAEFDPLAAIIGEYLDRV